MSDLSLLLKQNMLEEKDINTALELRQTRKEVLKKIYEKDLLGKSSPEKLMFEWSETADRLIQRALDLTLQDIPNPPQFCVLALGKLGGKELNYSSDVDLIYIYEGDFEAATKIAGRLTKLLNDVTEDGFVFRVDLNLRPDGPQGHLVNTIDALERYYEMKGEEWERQALIRSRAIAGSLKLGEEFISRVKPFVFRKSIDLTVLKGVRATKIALERSAESKEKYNLKLGPGGIREIEFFVQIMQMLHGGKIKKLQTPNTFEALDLLKKNKLISKQRHSELEEAYIFLRRIENLIQGENDRQTHSLPKDSDKLDRLAKITKFGSREEFLSRLDEQMHTVQAHFSSLFETDYEKSEIADDFEANLETCKDEEEKVDSLPWFKGHIIKRIQELDLAGKLLPDDTSEKLTWLAEIILAEALKITKRRVSQNHGRPKTSGKLSSELAVIAFGKMGAGEMDYGSDLDLVFIYDGDGKTSGPKTITNREYFTKIAQGILATISIPTRYGKAYIIDTELRPSGNQGTLLTSLEAFDRYHRREASFWERQALLRARIVAGDVSLGRTLTDLIRELTFEPPLPPDAGKQIHEMREKVIQENNPLSDQLNIKTGLGGLADVETIVHYLQLLHGREISDLQCRKLSEAIRNLRKHNIITQEEFSILNPAHNLFRGLISRSRLLSAHATDTIDIHAEHFKTLTRSMGFQSEDGLLLTIENLRNDVRKIYSAKVFSLRS